MSNQKPFILEIQENVLSQEDTKVFKNLLVKYIEKTKLPIGADETASSSLSNCRDTETECTCDRDD